jgi:high-affinity iron transporter
MKRLTLLTVAMLSCWTALAWSAEPDARQLWQLLDYVAVDYGGAVADGKVISASEYAEMQEFASSAAQQVQSLPANAAKDALTRAVADLGKAVADKADGATVARLAHHANDILLGAYPIPVAPKSIPDPTHGAALYAENCAQCHGAAGAGDGPLAANLDPKPIAFTDPDRARSRSLMALYQVISQGVEGTSMTNFSALPDGDRWALAFFVGTLSYDDAMRKRGEELWRNDVAMKNRYRDLAAVTTITEQAAAEGVSKDAARDITAYLRSHPDAVNAGEPEGLALARQKLKESLDAMHAGDRANATRLALSAYLDGFEPIEPIVGARNKSLLAAVERSMGEYRAAISDGHIDRAESVASQLNELFSQVDAELAGVRTDATTTFIGAMTILLREGVEALLIVIGMIAFLKKAKRTQALRQVHAGWIGALLAGLLTWAVATYLVAISGASREVTEGVGSVLAAVVLLSVGLWMHQKSSAGRWQSYLTHQLSAALTRRSAWALFALSFIAVYREAFETVLFYSALATDGNGTALLGGFAAAVALLGLIAWILLRTSARMPIGKFFSITSIAVAVLAVVLIGKGVAGLQEAGWAGVHPVAGPRIDILGVFPTAETLTAQLIVLLIALSGFGMNIFNARRAQTA